MLKTSVTHINPTLAQDRINLIKIDINTLKIKKKATRKKLFQK